MRELYIGSSGGMVQYMQETDRTGRDGLPANAVILKTSLQGIDKCMKEYYCNKNICRLHHHLQHFTHQATCAQALTECVCCDV